MSNLADIDFIPNSVSEDELIAAIEGRVPALGRSQALKELSRRRSTRITEVVTRVLADPSLPSTLRTTAAIELGKNAKAEHQQALIRALSSEEPIVLKRVVEAMGKIGDRTALQHLEALQYPPSHPASQSIDFAKALISYRLGLGLHLLALPSTDRILEFDPHHSSFLQISPLDPATLRRVAPTLQRKLPAIAISDNGAIEIFCGNNQFWLIFNQDMHQSESLSIRNRRNALPAVLMKKSPCLGHFFVYEYLFMHRDQRRTALLFGVRATGKIVHFGRLRFDQEIAFQLNALNTRYSPAIDIAGHYSQEEHRLTFTRAQVRTSFDPMQIRAAAPRKLNFEVE
ncbi:HEAT repeat domain-containing protein [Microcoleus sp. herbarium7]|uniref:HEAT repeat domain-containing protein n=1 Tax=Microcoleus sp. herbarium7 TaxID=3055435 RepID=UPI002FD07B5E